MAKKTYILASENVSDEVLNAEQDNVLEELYGESTFIVAEKGGALIVDESEKTALIQEYK